MAHGNRFTGTRDGAPYGVHRCHDVMGVLRMNAKDVKKFYGEEAIAKQEKEDSRGEERRWKVDWVQELRTMPSSILGPREFWMEFEKQADALAMARKQSTDFDMLCTFVYQRDNGYRKFVVAHPERYWWHYEHRSAEKRCSYEIIPESSPCRLYLDLEYPIELNEAKDGSSMTNTVIDVFSTYLLARWSLPCSRCNVINLDSSSDEKFSRHLTFNVRGVAFKDNYHVGRLVKSVCRDIVTYVSSPQTRHDILSSFDRGKLEQLLVETKRGKRLFIDTAVYTKNRHFRIYKSTKWGKRSNLIISNDCKYVPSNAYRDKELAIFLDSLISYFYTRKDLILLECWENGIADSKSFKREETSECDSRQTDDICSAYPILDRYIRSLIQPGKIRACKFYESAKVLVYETSGYRYCENIGRCHKSNNVFWVVNLEKRTAYQKCHDEDCFGFKSESKRLPEEICFQIADDDDDDVNTLVSCAMLTEDVA